MREPSWWTEERTDELKARWSKGETCSQIAKAMNVISRSAVIGKVHRLKLGARASAHNNAARSSKRHRKSRCITSMARFLLSRGRQGMIEEPPPPVFENPVSFFDLAPHHCRWPGGGEMPDLLFCGAPVANGYSYCAAHCRIAFDGTLRWKWKVPRR
jgi:GcrA cell cycle regulator